jgi:hypothetical protein
MTLAAAPNLNLPRWIEPTCRIANGRNEPDVRPGTEPHPVLTGRRAAWK